MRVRASARFAGLLATTFLVHPLMARPAPQPAQKPDRGDNAVGVLRNEQASLYRRGLVHNPRDLAGGTYFPAILNEYVFIGAFSNYNSLSCTSSGAPSQDSFGVRYNTHGGVAFGPIMNVTQQPGQPCAGSTFPGQSLYYIWTDAAFSAYTDPLQVEVRLPPPLLPSVFNFNASIDSTETDKLLGKPKCPCGDPIDVASGNVYEESTDYKTADGRLAFIRSYNSAASINSAATTLGPNWRSNFDRYLHLTFVSGVASSATVERPDGQILQFTNNGGVWTPDSDVSASLTASGLTYTFTAPDDTIETYTVASPTAVLASVASITVRGGYSQNLAYDVNQVLQSVTDLYGRALSFTYSNGLISAVKTADAQTIQYGYATVTAPQSGFAANVLSSVTFPTSPASTQTYLHTDAIGPGLVTALVDENRNTFASWSYDQNGRGTASQHAGGADLTTISYNDQATSRTVTNALGVADTYSFTLLQGIPKLTGISRVATSTTAAATESFSYDSNGYLASVTDWNTNRTTYTNDARGNPTQVVEAAGLSVARTTTTTWAPILHVPTSVATQGLTTSYTYDSAGNQYTKTELASGLSRTWTTSWSSGLLASISGPRTDVSQVTQFSYNASGALTGIKDAAGHVTNITSTTVGGLPLRQVAPGNIVTTFTYDGRQRLLTSKLSTSAGVLTTSNAYDAAGNLIQRKLPDGSFDMKTYDAAHRLVADTNALGQSTSYMLDALGDRQMTVVTDSTGKVTWQVADAFDALGRRISEKKGAGQTSSYAYDPNGNLTAVMDGRSLQTSNSYDGLDRLSQVKDPAGGLTTYSYDQHDRITQVAAPNGAVTGYVLDGFGRATTTNSPDTGSTTATYDLADNQTSSTDGAGVVTNHTYDALNRLKSTSYPSDASENVTEVYDQAGHGFGIGRLTSVTDAVGSVSYTYDERANRLSEARITGGLTLTTSYSYDKASRLAGVTYPSGTATGFTYDLAGQPSAVMATTPGTTTAVPLAMGFAWKPFGPLAGVTYGDGTVEARSYDLAYRLGGITAGSVQSLAYAYDGDDNATTITDAVTAANSHTLTYDSLNRIGTDKPGSGGTNTLKYDASGNRTANPSTTYTYAPKSNLLTQYATATLTTTVSSNGVGSITAFTPATGNATRLGYNSAERLASVQVGSTIKLTNTYDAFGRRMLKTAGPTSTLFQYDPAGHLLEERDTTAGTLASQDTVYLGNAPLADINPGTGAIFFLHTDHLGAPQVATTSQGAVAWQGTYNIFGSATAPTGLLTQNLRLPGQYADTTTAYSQNGFRDYYPALGRYLESDPIGLNGGINTFAYVGNNPANFIDPLGTGALGAAIGGAIGGDFGADAGGVAGAFGGSIAGPGGTVVGGVVGADVGGVIGSRAGAAAGSAIEDAINNVLNNTDHGSPYGDTGLTQGEDGKIHGEPLPDHVPDNLTDDQLRDLEQDLEKSIEIRKAQQQSRGHDYNHDLRLNQEERLLRQIRKKRCG